MKKLFLVFLFTVLTINICPKAFGDVIFVHSVSDFDYFKPTESIKTTGETLELYEKSYYITSSILNAILPSMDKVVFDRDIDRNLVFIKNI